MQDIDLASFIENDIPSALKRAAKLKRSRLAPAGAAHACSAVFCSMRSEPGRAGGVRVHVGPGVFSESEGVVKVAKGALKQLETIAFGGGSGLAAWLLARCCRV